jgi:hypothetical protein
VDEGKLLLLRPHDGTGRLVFGDTGDAGGGAPDANFSLDADLPGLGDLALVYGAVAALDAPLDDFTGNVPLVWDANVSRGGLRCELQSVYQGGQPVAAALASRWQATLPMPTGLQARWQQAEPRHGALQPRWQQAEPLRAAVHQRYQAAGPVRGATRQHWQEAERLRGAVLQRYQEGLHVRGATRQHWQETLRLRCAVLHHYQQGLLARAAVRSHYEPALPVWIAQRQHWQDAMRPGAGMYVPPVVRPREPCYDPATLGRLVFTDLALGVARLVFVCQRAGWVLPPAGIVVLPRRSYVVINSIEIRRVDNLAGDPLPSESFGMQLNHQSWTWSFSASFHASARDALMPGAGGEPIELEVRVNNQPFRLQAERIGRSRRFPEHMVTATGRGKAALLDAPHAPVQTFTNALDRTAQQLMTQALTVNGVGFGWSVDFRLTDWLVPGGVWMHQGTWASALAEIAAAAGGYLQPHDTDPVLRVLPLWPKPWWEWDTLAPDIELPAGISEIDETEVVDLPGYNRIFVSGEAGGHAADLTRGGTPGDVLKQPMALHPLITTMGAAKQRAIAELAESGRMLKHKMTLPVLPATGVIRPGTVLRYADDVGALRLGLVRATSIAQQFPVLTQSLEIDSHA